MINLDGAYRIVEDECARLYGIPRRASAPSYRHVSRSISVTRPRAAAIASRPPLG